MGLSINLTQDFSTSSETVPENIIVYLSTGVLVKISKTSFFILTSSIILSHSSTTKYLTFFKLKKFFLINERILPGHPIMIYG
jgi:hypothetical protein